MSLARLHLTPGSHEGGTAELIRRVYEVDSLVCPRCGSEMRVTADATRSLARLRSRPSL